MDSVIEVTGHKSKVTVTFNTEKEDGEPKNGTPKMRDGTNDSSLFKLHRGGEEAGITTHYLVVCVAGKKKRKACSTTEDSPAKKIKFINDGMETHNAWTDAVFCCFNPPFLHLV